MKYFLNILLVFMLICCLLCSAETANTTEEAPAEEPVVQTVRIKAPDPDSLTSKSCILIDSDTGEVLYEKDADARRYPASTTKIMTLLVSIRNMDSEMIVKVPDSASNVSFDSTRVPVYPGEVMPLRDLWYGLIYKSGNDAANAIATLTAGSVDEFVVMMNEYAERLGMTNTHFANAHGLHDEKHYTTARDMATLTRFALQSDLFREITFSTEYTMQATTLRDELIINHIYSLTDFTSSYYYKYARGIKTGYTVKAGQCYVGAAIKDGHELIVVCLNAGGYKPQKWIDSKTLFEYGFAVLESR